MTNCNTLANQIITENNAYEVCIGLTRRLRDALRADDKQYASIIRLARAAAFDRYEELHGTDDLEDTQFICDRIIMGECQ